MLRSMVLLLWSAECHFLSTTNLSCRRSDTSRVGWTNCCWLERASRQWAAMDTGTRWNSYRLRILGFQRIVNYRWDGSCRARTDCRKRLIRLGINLLKSPEPFRMDIGSSNISIEL